MGGSRGEKGVKHNSFNSNVSMNSMASEAKVRKMYEKVMNSYEDLMVEMKYESQFTNSQIKKEMNRLNKLYLDDFFKRAK